MLKNAICLGEDKRFSYIRSCIENERPLSEADLIILPFTPSNELLDKVFSSLRNDQIVVYGGNIKKEFRDRPNVVCYSKSEEFQMKNAYLTAEAVLSILIDELEMSLTDANIAVTGFGRIGKCLSSMLSTLGSAPKTFSCKGGNLVSSYEDFEKYAKSFDCVVNTAPALVLDEKKLAALKKDCLLIEVASKPYGIDFSSAEKFGLRYIIAGSLPGKKSPQSAAKIILEEIEKISFKGE